MTSQKTASGGVEAIMGFGRHGFEPDMSDPNDPRWSEFTERHRVIVSDGRQASGLSLDRNGFALRHHKSEIVDFYDAGSIVNILVPEALALIRDISGSDQLLFLEKVVRGPRDLKEQKPHYAQRITGYAGRAHIDGDEGTFRRWADHLAPQGERAHFRKRPFTVYNIWRPIEPVEMMPLAFCDAATVHAEDLIPSRSTGLDPKLTQDEYLPEDLRYFHLAYGAHQRWYYFPDMTPDEVVIFKQWDSDPARACHVPHCAFADPHTRPDARARQSIEIRILALEAA